MEARQELSSESAMSQSRKVQGLSLSLTDARRPHHFHNAWEGSQCKPALADVRNVVLLGCP
jgi:hypothetical protein